MRLVFKRQCYQPPNAGPSLMPDSIRSTLRNKLPPKRNKNDYNEQFISIFAHLFPINLNIICYYTIKFIKTLKYLL
jgi:hypothetical protein